MIERLNGTLQGARSELAKADPLGSLMFRYGEDGWRRAIQHVLLGGLYLLGVSLCAYLLRGGSIQFNLHDWVEAGHRYAFLKDAVTGGKLPLHTPGDWALRGVTLRFINVVDTNLSPQVLLLRFLDLGPFVLINTLLLYSIGFSGLLRLRKRYQLSLYVTGFMFLLLFFNGHVVDHLAVGHTHWAAYFLSPWILLATFDALRSTPGWRWVAGTALLLFFVFLQGAFHLFVLLLLLFVLLGLGVPKLLATMLKMAAFAGLLSAVRILPVLLDFQKFDTGFFTGFEDSRHLVEGLLILRSPIPGEVYSPLPFNPLGWWEFDYYVGLAGLLFAASFFMLRAGERDRWTTALLVPMAVMTALSIGEIYDVIHHLGIPVLASQRVSSRLFIIPLVLAIGASSIRLQSLFDAGKLGRGVRLAALGGLALAAHDLWQHLKLWRLANMGRLFEPTAIDLSRNVVVSRVDPAYVALLAAGAAVSLGSLAALALLVIRERRANGGTGS